jgi:hypothetical protein
MHDYPFTKKEAREWKMEATAVAVVRRWSRRSFPTTAMALAPASPYSSPARRWKTAFQRKKKDAWRKKNRLYRISSALTQILLLRTTIYVTYMIYVVYDKSSRPVDARVYVWTIDSEDATSSASSGDRGSRTRLSPVVLLCTHDAWWLPSLLSYSK